MVTAHSVRRLLAGTSSPSSVTRNAQCRPDTANRCASPVSCMATASPSGSSVLSPVSSAVRKPRTDGSSQMAAIRSRKALTARCGSHCKPPLLPSVTDTSSR